jgi:MATE family multidrug resistance protein
MALAAIVSQLAGAKKYVDISNETYQTGWIALTLGLALIGVYYLLAPSLYNSVTIEADLKDLLFDYLGYIVWGAPGYCLYLVLRNYSEGLSYTKPTMVISIIGLIVNIPANYIFIYGGFGIPALGGAGCGIATAIVYWAMFISMAVYCYKSDYLKKANLFSKFYWPNLSKIKNILMLGVPLALSLLFEVSLFAVVAILLVPFGAEIVASHQIALNFTSLIFMVPLSIAMAITIKVGFAIGDNNFQQAKDYCFHAIIFGLILAILTALITLVFRFQIASIYTSDVGVIELAASLMFLAALYQFSDTVQVISAGALRGYKDTQAILILTFISYWLVGLPVGLILGMTDWIVPRTGPFGFWIGFISGLTIAAVLLAWRLKVIQKRFEDQAIEQQLIND